METVRQNHIQISFTEIGDVLRIRLALFPRETAQTGENLPLEPDQAAGQKALPEERLRFETVGNDIVDVLEEDDVRIQPVEVRDQSAVASRPENQLPSLRSQRSMIEIDRNGVGSRILRRKTDIEDHGQTRLIKRDGPRQKRPDGRLVFKGDREVDPGKVVGIARVERRLDQVLLEGGSAAVGVAVKLQKGLREAAVVQAPLRQDVSHEGGRIPRLQELVQGVSPGGNCRLQITEKGKTPQIPGKNIRFVAGGKAPVFQAAVPRMEHPAGRSGGRNEFHDPVGSTSLLELLGKKGAIRLGKDDDPIPRPAGPVQPRPRDAPLENLQLPLHLFDG